jgi:hypothetical protein
MKDNDYKRFLPEIWKDMSIDERQDTLQSIVNLFCKELGIDDIPKVWIDKFPKDSTRIAEHVPNARQILIRDDLVDGGNVKIKDDIVTHKWYLQQVYFSLMHELRHAIQKYYVDNPSLCFNKKWLNLIESNRITNDPNTNSYFSVKKNLNSVLKDRAMSLYALQPSEIDANLFAYEQLKIFVSEMHKRYPESWMYNDLRVILNINTQIETAKIRFRTETPIQDIGSILFLIDNKDVGQQINPYVCNAIHKTQDVALCKRLEIQLNHRQQTIYDLSESQRLALNEEIDESIFLDELNGPTLS